MASSQDDSEWEKSTSEIQSEDSENLFESRPNRWRGPPQSWRTLTEEDRLTFNALERLRNQDLSVHLYNAFSLKRHLITHDGQPINAESQPQGSQLEPWAPPKSWTAWPLRADLAPPDDFMKRTEDDDEALTFRRLENKAPSTHLEEVMSAAILRCAKEKFRKRQLHEALASAQKGKAIRNEPASSENASASSETESGSESGSEKGKETAQRATSQKVRGKAAEKTYKAAVATDDDVSYELIRPSTRAILSKLDQTLTILHNARATSYQRLTDSASSSSDTEGDFYNEATSSGHRSRPRTKERSHTTSRASSMASSPSVRSRSPSLGAAASASPSKPARRRDAGATAREGESERDFLRRRAREQKKRQPVFSDDETAAAAAAAAKGTRSPRKSRRRQKRTSSGEGEYWTHKRLERFNLRDWSDVMGAAALAGFDAKVVERATQRCANLFGQGMEMHAINEGVEMETKRYVPGRVIYPSDSEDEDQDDQANVDQKRVSSRQSSLAPSSAISSASSDGDERNDKRNNERTRVESPRKRQRRSSSRGSAGEPYYCRYVGCDRAIRSFDRPGNLRRHLKLVHGEVDGHDGNRSQPDHAESDKELHYCTHMDCERAIRPFDKGHNLRRHLQRVHGENIGGRSQAGYATERAVAAETPAAGQFFCPHVGCERASRAFDRRPNLRRHLNLIHGQGESQRLKQSPRRDHGKKYMAESTSEVVQRGKPSDEDDSESTDESSTESESGSASD